MKAMKYRIFDLFSYAISGAILITACIFSYNILDIENNTLKILLKKKNTVLLITLIVLISHMSGFITNILSGYFYKLIALIAKKQLLKIQICQIQQNFYF